MSFFNYLFDSEWAQRQDIEKLKAKTRASMEYQSRRDSRAAARIERLENDLAEAALLLRSIYVYLKAQPGFDADKFKAIVERIDAMDGKMDGKAKRSGP